MGQLIMDHGVSGWFGTKLASARRDTGTEVTGPVQAAALPQPAQTKCERDGSTAAILPLWMPYAHTIRHTCGTSQYTASSSDRFLPPVHNPFRTAYTGRHRGDRFDHEPWTDGACNRQSSCTSVHNLGISECVQVPHGGPPTSNNARLFGYTLHGSLGTAEYICASPHPWYALPGLTSHGCPTRHRTMQKPWARS